MLFAAPLARSRRIDRHGLTRIRSERNATKLERIYPRARSARPRVGRPPARSARSRLIRWWGIYDVRLRCVPGRWPSLHLRGHSGLPGRVVCLRRAATPHVPPPSLSLFGGLRRARLCGGFALARLPPPRRARAPAPRPRLKGRSRGWGPPSYGRIGIYCY